MKTLKLDPCVPPFWARGAHPQTLWGHLLPSERLSDRGHRVELSLPDGDRLIGSFLSGASRTIVYLFHGLAGSIDSSYIHRTAMVARRHGHAVFMVNHRGCGEGAGLARKPYHSGRAEDLSAVIAHGRERFPDHRHLAIGFSMSANALLLLLSGRRGVVKPDFAVAVNAPIHLESASRLLGRGLNRIYDFDFLRRCKRDAFIASGQEVQLPLWSTLHDFDAAYTAEAGEFKSREDYYASCSTKDLLHGISTPTVVLTSKDDPFVHFHHYAEARMSAAIQFHAEECGGHMGYLAGKATPLGTTRWLDYAMDRAILAFH